MDCDKPGSTVKDLKVRSGFWRADGGITSMLPCPIPKACVGTDRNRTNDTSHANETRNGTNRLCAWGHHGPLCALCETGYTRMSALSLCAKCPESLGLSILWSVFFAALMGLCVWILVRISRRSKNGSLRPVINAWQTLSVVLLTSSDWPAAVKWVQKFVLQTVNLDFISVTSPSCVLGFPVNFYHRIVATAAGCLCLIGGPWLLAVGKYRRRNMKLEVFNGVLKNGVMTIHLSEEWNRAKSRLLHDSILLTLIVYTLVTGQVR